MAVAIAEKLLTAEEYCLLPDNGQPTELVRGKVVPLDIPWPRHGQICANVVYLLRRHLDDHPLGHIVCNDSGVPTEHDPDTVRGADVAFFSYARVPAGPLPSSGYLPVPPEVVFEVRSPFDRWKAVLTKVAEYLNAGVGVVCVLDDASEAVHVFTDDDPVRILTAEQTLTLPGVLPEFQVVVRRFFA
jgi:Uma2 family endonuclease